ncbi:unnamed protein product [Phytophthora fragariaefolia]|uniref:Unnamed protein product n=1 Tax=Phytophthora fragariaefolia TaxID=1490495 RepID=A0A9W6Y0H7_9STRA|nr:unnamed protein product [Phytophthora fragariaefolia]
MKPIQLCILLCVVDMLESPYAVGFDWQPEDVVEIPENAVIHPPNVLRRMQTTTDKFSTESMSSASAASNSASAASSTTETEAPTTIMVLLPDNLAPNFSGSGSTMFFDGSVGDDEKNGSPPTGSQSTADEASGAASFGFATVLAAFTIMSAFMLA